MIVIEPQFWIVCDSISLSCGFELKLDPDDRDSQTSCGNVMHFPLRPRAALRLMPNSATALAPRAAPLIPLSAPAMADWFDWPSNSDESGMMTFAPQQGGALATRQPLTPF